jgi:hypothetical protein
MLQQVVVVHHLEQKVWVALQVVSKSAEMAAEVMM